ncbi:glycosyltransferase family 4 protein [[Clostridium] fimetarium]|uniref:Glycosyltransferase involved in cell wall bisynthesis n=1 Tax=[Clostridium] fimetarium TaxID=99656 RepID=A0A1I0RPT3_9FIRM|nr:glycosyltransferase family 4 protein [[Clostridium] fimetarium]SEW42712.1 Glycosyltransferase involved in cell wall bisynthesis [[Clostridium] fimetarium]
MKVLMTNKFLYPKGGAETYIFSLGKILAAQGHEVQYFGLKNEKNIVGNNADALVDDMDFSIGIKNNLKALFRIVYNFQAKKQIRKVLVDFKPDIVHLNNIQFHLTPSIIIETDKWRKENHSSCKIIYTAHDYQLVCPSHGMFDINVKSCEKCLDGRYIHCFKTKCLKNSKAKSLLGTIDGYFWKYSSAYSYLNAIICPSKFLKEKLDTQPQFRDKTIVLHNFMDIVPLQNANKEDYILEFGKLCKDKGTDTLIEVAKKMPDQKFVFAGYGPSVEKMNGISNIEYLGFKGGDELYKLIAEAKISVCPSEWYENCPFSVIESISLGTPVVGSRIGGIPELIVDRKTGELFEAGNAIELEKAIRRIIDSKSTMEQYTKNCYEVKYETSETYYTKLMEIYEKRNDHAK